MRFITEFESSNYGGSEQHYSEQRALYDLGKVISESFGWDEKGRTTLHGPVTRYQSLEIEAFPMDKWIEFKKRFADALPDYDVVSRTRLINAMADLESFGKPAGDTITNLKLTNGTE